MSEGRSGSEFIQMHIDAETIRVLEKAMRIIALAFVSVVALVGAVLYLDLHGLVWARSNYWPVFLSLLFPAVVGMALVLIVCAWLVARAAAIYAGEQSFH